MFNIYNMGIYTDYSKIRGIRMVKKVHYNDIYSYNTREDKNLTKEDILYEIEKLQKGFTQVLEATQ